MNLNEALAWLDEHENTNSEQQLCYITKRPIEDNITLKCGHSFEYIALYTHLMKTQNKNTTHTCPYCRSCYPSFIPFHEKSLGIDHVYRDTLFKNMYLKCSHTFVSGKRKGCQCNRPAQSFQNGIFCFNHYKQRKLKEINFNVNKCSQTLQNGKACTCKIFDEETKLCKRHYNLMLKKQLKK